MLHSTGQMAAVAFVAVHTVTAGGGEWPVQRTFYLAA